MKSGLDGDGGGGASVHRNYRAQAPRRCCPLRLSSTWVNIYQELPPLPHTQAEIG